jgi:hypothetical protein
LKRILIAALLLVALAVAASAVAADEARVSGGGKTNAGANFNVYSADGKTGHFSYSSPLVDASCRALVEFIRPTSSDPWPTVALRCDTVNSVSGHLVRIRGHFVDRGEPGTRDAASFYVYDWTTHAPVISKPPCSCPSDQGWLTAGNVQIR